MVARYIIMALMEDKEFLEIYKLIFVLHKDEEDNYGNLRPLCIRFLTKNSRIISESKEVKRP